jgi:predicted CoA-binding protein
LDLSKEDIKEILSTCKTIAVVGLSREPEKDSYRVAAYMKKHGYRIVPVNPFVDEVLGEKSYKSLLDIPTEIQKEIDVVDVFRRAEDAQPVAEQTVKLGDAWKAVRGLDAARNRQRKSRGDSPKSRLNRRNG